METVQFISVDQLRTVIAAIYEQGPSIVKEAYSEYDSVLKEFVDADSLTDELHFQPGQKYLFRSYVIYYPEAKGHVYEERIALKPDVCDGHTFRFCQNGWGLIQLQIRFQKYPRVECRIAVNSEVRAQAWSVTYPKYLDPGMWDWKVVNSKVGKLIRLLRKLGKLSTE